MAQVINADDGSVSGSAGLKSSSDGTAVLTLQTKGSNALTVDASQNVGIGTTSPGAKLSVDGSAIFNDSGADVDFRVEGDTDANLLFVDASTDRVGVGTDTPAVKFDIVGGGSEGQLCLSNNATNSTNKDGKLVVRHYTNSEENFLVLYPYSTATVNEIYYGGGSSSQNAATGHFWLTAANNTTTSGTTRMTLDSAGNLGLGVTPSAWGSSIKALEGFTTNSTWSIAAGGGLGDAINIQNNAYYDGSNWIYKASATATNYYQNLGAHAWRIAGSGTAGGTISWTTAMTLDASGNLGLGTASPNISAGAAGSQCFTISATQSGRNALIELKGTRTGANQVSSYIRSFSNSGATPGVDLQFYVGATDTDGFLTISTSGSERARIDAAGNLIQTGVTTAAGPKVSSLSNSSGNTTVNNSTYTINLASSAKLFWVYLSNGDAALVFTSYVSNVISFLGPAPVNIVASASPGANELGISKSGSSHDIVIKTGSNLSSTASAWAMGSLSSEVS